MFPPEDLQNARDSHHTRVVRRMANPTSPRISLAPVYPGDLLMTPKDGFVVAKFPGIRYVRKWSQRYNETPINQARRPCECTYLCCYLARYQSRSPDVPMPRFYGSSGWRYYL